MRNRAPSDLGGGPYVTNRPARAFLAVLRERGHDVDEILAPFGLREEVLLEKPRLSHAVSRALLDRALEVTNDPALGIHACRHAETLGFDLLEYVSATCQNRAEAVEVYNRYNRFSHDAARLSVWTEGDLAATVYETEGELDEPPAWIDFALGWIVVFGRRVSGRNERLVRVEFRYPRPAEIRPYEEFFGAPLHFGATRNAVVYRREDYMAPFPQADSRLRELLERQSEWELEKMPSAQRLQDELRALLPAEFARGKADLKQVAKRLGMAPSTVRQRLQLEGTTFRAIVDEQRKKLATEYLRDTKRSIGEIASLLGFAYESALVRAFRRWTGMSPSEYRRQHLL